MNSWVVNSYNSTYNNDRVVQGLKQANASWSMLNSLGFTGSCGVPAFGNTEIGQVGFLYFDTDSALINANNDANDHYGQMIKNLFDCSIESTQNPLPLKFEIAGKTIFSKYALHPGFVGKPHFEIALSMTKIHNAQLSIRKFPIYIRRI